MLAPDPGLAGSAPSYGGRLSLAEALDRVLHCGVSAQGELTLGLADVELLFIDLRLLLGSVDSIWPEGRPPAAAVRPRGPSSVTPPHEEAATAPAAPVVPGSAKQIASEPRNLPLQNAGAANESSSTAQGLVRLVLTLVRLLHDLLERQALRRMEGGRLTEVQIDNIGAALFAQAEEILRLQQQFGFSDKDLSLALDLPEGAS